MTKFCAVRITLKAGSLFHIKLSHSKEVKNHLVTQLLPLYMCGCLILISPLLYPPSSLHSCCFVANSLGYNSFSLQNCLWKEEKKLCMTTGRVHFFLNLAGIFCTFAHTWSGSIEDFHMDSNFCKSYNEGHHWDKPQLGRFCAHVSKKKQQHLLANTP